MTKENQGDNLTSEERLLMRLSKIFVDDEDKAAIKAILTDEVDVDYLLELCKNHHTLPICYKNLSLIEIDFGASNKEAYARLLCELKKYYKQSIMQNMLLSEECVRLLRAFKAKGLKVVVNQGMALISTVYSFDIALRPMMDIDFLIRKKDFDIAKGVLSENGFKMHRAEKEEFARDIETSIAFRKRTKGFTHIQMTIELHYWDDYKHDPVGGIYNFDVDAIFSRAKEIDFQGVSAHVLSYEDFMIHHIFHVGLSHQFTRLVWFNDMALVMSQKDFDY